MLLEYARAEKDAYGERRLACDYLGSSAASRASAAFRRSIACSSARLARSSATRARASSRRRTASAFSFRSSAFRRRRSSAADCRLARTAASRSRRLSASLTGGAGSRAGCALIATPSSSEKPAGGGSSVNRPARSSFGRPTRTRRAVASTASDGASPPCARKSDVAATARSSVWRCSCSALRISAFFPASTARCAARSFSEASTNAL